MRLDSFRLLGVRDGRGRIGLEGKALLRAYKNAVAADHAGKVIDFPFLPLTAYADRKGRAALGADAAQDALGEVDAYVAPRKRERIALDERIQPRRGLGEKIL